MVKSKILIIIFTVVITISILGTFSEIQATEGKLEVWEEEQQVEVDKVKEYRENVEKEINKNGVTYKLKDISEQENKKTMSKNKEIEKDLIVNTTNRYDVLNMFKQEINIKENGYTGTLKINNVSLKIEENDTYKEEYKVYYEEKYENVKSNELNNIPKTIKKDGIVYYLINPVWTVSETQNIDGQEVPVSYNGIMKYEAIKVRTIVSNYKATVKYSGELKKEVVDSVTFILQYEEIPIDKGENENKQSNMLPTVATGTGIIIFSGIIFISRKNILIYNYQNNNWKLIRKIKASGKLIDITPQNNEISRKYKIVLKNDLYNKWYGQNITVKYFDKQFICNIKENEIEIVV